MWPRPSPFFDKFPCQLADQHLDSRTWQQGTPASMGVGGSGNLNAYLHKFYACFCLLIFKKWSAEVSEILPHNICQQSWFQATSVNEPTLNIEGVWQKSKWDRAISAQPELACVSLNQTDLATLGHAHKNQHSCIALWETEPNREPQANSNCTEMAQSCLDFLHKNEH